MSVDTLRETFHISRVSSKLLGDFLTAQTYRQEITEAKEKIQQLHFTSVQNVCDRPIRQGKSPKYSNATGLICIKPKNTREIIVELEDCDFIDPLSREELSQQKLQYADVVITRSGAGTIGRASIFFSKDTVYTNDHLFIIRATRTDSAYLCAYLRSYWGERLLEAGISGSTGQLNLSNDYIKSLLLYSPPEKAQQYIGDKVCQAERLRVWAKNSECKFTDNISACFSEVFKGEVDQRNYSIASGEKLLLDLNPGLYNPERLRVRQALLNNGGVRLSSVANIATPATNKYTVDDKYLGLDGISSVNSALIVSTVGVEQATGTLRLLVSGPVISKLRPYLNKVAFVPEDLNGAVGSSELLCVISNNKNDSWFLYGVLKQATTLKQLNPIATGATHPRVSTSDILDLVIPWVNDRAEKGSWLEKAFHTRRIASALTTSTKFLVEALIEGKITEPQLIAAQQALETGDNTLDREILSRLKTDGLDGEGEPLFPDLDRLYDLLDQAQQASAA